MISYQAAIVAKLDELCGNVSDGYPEHFTTYPAVALTEEENRPELVINEGEVETYLRYKIDIWAKASTTALCTSIDEAMVEIGFRRSSGQTIGEPNGLRHKALRYEAIYDHMHERLYFNN